MSTILNELVKIREKLDSDGTYSGSTVGVPETVTQIRELVENGAGGGSGGGFTPAELVIDGDKFTVKATPETIDSVFVAAADGLAIYRTIAEGSENTNYYAVFMGNFDGPTLAAKQFVYDETAGGYVYEGGYN